MAEKKTIKTLERAKVLCLFVDGAPDRLDWHEVFSVMQTTKLPCGSFIWAYEKDCDASVTTHHCGGCVDWAMTFVRCSECKRLVKTQGLHTIDGKYYHVEETGKPGLKFV
jgi:hypothetical protein